MEGLRIDPAPPQVGDLPLVSAHLVVAAHHHHRLEVEAHLDSEGPRAAKSDSTNLSSLVVTYRCPKLYSRTANKFSKSKIYVTCIYYYYTS